MRREAEAVGVLGVDMHRGQEAIRGEFAGDSEGQTTDNGMLKPAVTDISLEDAEKVDLTFDEKLEALEAAVTRHPLNREILYRILGYCEQERLLVDCERCIMAFPEYASATQNPFHMLQALVQSFGLYRIERDEQGNVVSPEQKEGLTEDEVDDLVFSFGYRTTEVGQAFFQAHAPKARLVELLQLDPWRNDTYIELLEFIGVQPRTYQEVTNLLAGRPVLETVIDGVHETMQPSVFVDKLERSGALVWKEGWCLTKEGEDFLTDMKVAK